MRHRPCCCDGAGAPEFLSSLRPDMRARGTPDARRIRSPVCKVVKAHERSRHGHAVCIRRSARGGVPACFVLSPANARRLSPSSPLRPTLPVGSERGRPDFAGPHDLGRRGRAVMRCVSTPQSRAQRGSSAVARAAHTPPDVAHALAGACTRSGLAPCDPRSGLTLPRHRIPPRAS
jgi:hypothetical protein